jgi:hypothetical protein
LTLGESETIRWRWGCTGAAGVECNLGPQAASANSAMNANTLVRTTRVFNLQASFLNLSFAIMCHLSRHGHFQPQSQFAWWWYTHTDNGGSHARSSNRAEEGNAP